MELLGDRKTKKDVIEERGDGPEVAAAAKEGGVAAVNMVVCAVSD